MAKKDITISLDERLLEAVEELAAHKGKEVQEVLEELLNHYLLFEVLEQVWSRSNLGEEEALKLAYDELHRSRLESS
ncbi:MAG: ribbon-helix-helix protein, CopG family [Chloroflexota bacterium]|nr:ribbon-helix-helix protein, CopG family [Chloroflexota bacterium]